MKTLFYISTLLFLVSCKNLKNVPVKTAQAKDTVSTAEIQVHQYGKLLKSKPFIINGIPCYWEQTDTLTDEGALDIIRLRDTKTKRLLVNHPDCCLKYGFDFNAPDHFLDVNFDGYQDFLIRSYGSMAMFEQTNIYLFDPKTKQFVYSDLSDNRIERDSINRKLITGSFDRDFEKTKTHYFDASGKVKYTEVITRFYSDSLPDNHGTYEKIVDGKVVKTVKDSLFNSEK